MKDARLSCHVFSLLMKTKYHSLIDKVCSLSNLRRAYRLCASHSSSSGIDCVTWYEYRQNLDDRLDDLSSRMANGSYKPKPYRVIHVKKQDKIRKLFIPTVEDRVVQKSLLLIIAPLFESFLSEYSFGYRYGKNRDLGILLATKLINSGKSWVADVDVQSLSLKARRSLLDTYLSKVIADGKVLRLIQTSLGSSEEGIPTGNGLTPFLSDVYLHQTDILLASQSVSHLRFSDTFLLFEDSHSTIEQVLLTLKHLLRFQSLSINEEKTILWNNPHPEDLFSRNLYYWILKNKTKPRVVNSNQKESKYE